MEHVIHFNSRPCARGDAAVEEDVSELKISIPAPARGATANLNKFVLRNLCEQANSKDACLLFYDM